MPFVFIRLIKPRCFRLHRASLWNSSSWKYPPSRWDREADVVSLIALSNKP